MRLSTIACFSEYGPKILPKFLTKKTALWRLKNSLGDFPFRLGSFSNTHKHVGASI